MKIIICEGKSDAIFISYYLEATGTWKSIEILAKGEKKETSKRIVSFELVDKKTEEVNWYIRDRELLCIRAAGGINKLSAVLNEVIEYNINVSNEHEKFEDIAIVADHDEQSTEEELLSEFNEVFVKFGLIIPQPIKCNQWNQSNEFKSELSTVRVYFLPLIIPNNELGAMETFLLNGLSCQDNTDNKVITQCREFIDNIDCHYVESENAAQCKYLSKRCEKTKAKFATFFAVACPRRVFDSGDAILKSICWEEYTTIRNEMKILLEKF